MKIILLGAMLLSGCAHYQYQTPTQDTLDPIQTTQQLTQIALDVYPIYYTINAIANH